MPDLKLEFKNLGTIHLMPLETSSLFLPFGRPIADYLRGLVASQNGMRILSRQGPMDFSPAIRWNASTAWTMRTTGFGELEREGVVEREVVVEAAAPPEPPAPGVADFLPMLRPDIAEREANLVNLAAAVASETPRIAKPRLAALPLRMRMTFGPPPPSKAKPVPAPAPPPPAPKPVAAPAAVKPAPAVVAPPAKPAPVPAPKPPVPVKVVAPTPVQPKPVTVIPPAPKASPAPAPAARATLPQAPAPVASPPAARAPEPPKPAPPPASPKINPPAAASPAPPMLRPAAPPLPAQTPAQAPLAKPAPAPTKPAVSVPAPKPIAPPIPVARPPLPAEAPKIPAALSREVEAPKPAPPPPRPVPVERTPEPMVEPHLTMGDEVPETLLERIPMALKIGACLLLVVVGMYFIFAKSSDKGVPDAAVAVGEQGWSTEWASDASGSRRARQLTLYRPTVGMSDYQMGFVGQIESKALGWVFREVDTSNYYAMKIETLAPGKMAVTHFAVIEGRESAYSQRPLAVDSRPGAAYRVKLDVTGPRFTTYVGGEPVDFWTDNRLKAGAFGLMNERDERGAASSLQLSFPKGSK